MSRTAAVRKTTTKARAAAPVPAIVGRFVRIGDTHVEEPARKLMWTHTLGEATFKKAQKLVDKANADKLGGFDDWRMPTVEELFCLADRSKYSPAIDTAAFPDTKSDWYWTSTPYSPYSGYAWIVSFHYGYSFNGHHDHDNFVRAVRASQ